MTAHYYICVVCPQITWLPHLRSFDTISNIGLNRILANTDMCSTSKLCKILFHMGSSPISYCCTVYTDERTLNGLLLVVSIVATPILLSGLCLWMLWTDE